MADDLNKPYFKPKFTSEFSMGALDFDRYDFWLKWVDYWSSIINSSELPTLEMVQKLYAGVMNLYDNWRPLMIPAVIREIDKAFDECKKKKRVWEKSIISGVEMNSGFILSLVDKLMAIKQKLYGIKQVIGLGIVVRRNLSGKQRIKKGMERKTAQGIFLPDV